MSSNRLRQVRVHLRPPAITTAQWARIEQILDGSQQVAFRALPGSEQAHHICVMQRIDVDEKPRDHDLLRAALLHDIGKVSNGRSPNLLDRTLCVIFKRCWPGLLDRLTAKPRWWNSGLILAANHPALGAEIAASLGCTPRTCDLIARHGDDDVSLDDALARLQRADSAC